MTLDSDSWICDSLVAKPLRMGFHVGDVWGPFSFARLLSAFICFVPERLVEPFQIVRDPLAERFTISSGKIHG